MSATLRTPSDLSSAAAYRSLGAAFLAACHRRGSRDLLVDAEVRVTGDAAVLECERLALALAALGLRTGRHVLFLARPGVWHTLAWFAAVRLGAVVTNLHLLETPARLAETAAWLDAAVLIHDAEFADLAAQIGAAVPALTVVALDTLASSRETGRAALDAAGGDAPAAVVLSSGSTGQPKGVIHTHATVLASIAAATEVYRGIDDSDSVLVCIGTSFGGWCNTVPPFLCHATKLVFQRRFDPVGFLDGLAAERVTVAPLVPTMWRMVLAAGPQTRDLSALKLAFMSGEMPSRADVAAIHAQVTGRVRSAYLSTEGACGCGVVMDEDVMLASESPAGRPVGGAEVEIVPLPGSDRDEEGIGEILLRGPSLAVGYWADPQRTAERFRDDGWHSGDTGMMTAAGLRVVGRTDHVINSGGVKIQAEELEAALMAHPGIRQAAVVGVADKTWGERAEAHVVVGDPTLDAEAVAAWCRSDGQGGALRLIKAIHVTERLPTGPTGKLYRPALRGGTP